MGTTYSITIVNFNHKLKNFQTTIDSSLNSINEKFSTYLENSEISNINASKTDFVYLSKDFEYVLKKALDYCKTVNGTYDITVGPLLDLWGFSHSLKKSIPSDKEITKALNNIGYKYLALNNSSLTKKNKNIILDLNSLAKGHGVDKISELLEANGYYDYLVEIGGEIRTGKSSNPDDWIIGIQHPKSNKILKKVRLNNLSMATSGTYNNYFNYNGLNYSHIINPFTGYPFKYKTVSATIISKYCIDSDALATVSMTLDPIDMIALINAKDDIEAYLVEISDDGSLIEYVSKGFDKLIYK